MLKRDPTDILQVELFSQLHRQFLHDLLTIVLDALERRHVLILVQHLTSFRVVSGIKIDLTSTLQCFSVLIFGVFVEK